MGYDKVMRHLETKQLENGHVQTGDIFIKLLSGNSDTAVRGIRVIMPIGYDHMVRFDVVVSVAFRNVIMQNAMFYKRGDKTAEKEALDG